MIEWLTEGGADQFAAMLGILVGLWGIGASIWRLNDTHRREAIALAAVSAALALFVRDRRTERDRTV